MCDCDGEDTGGSESPWRQEPVEVEGVGDVLALTNSLRLDRAVRGGGNALSAISRSGCNTYRESKHTVKKDH